MPLDGELWLDRKAFQRTVSIVRRQDKSDHWQEIKYRLFELPLSSEPFEERLKALPRLVRQHRPCVCHGSHQDSVASVGHLKAELVRVERWAAKGSMLRQPGSRYEAGRSSTLLKVKTFHDAEGVSSSIWPARAATRGGSAPSSSSCPTALKFSVGTGFSDAQREIRRRSAARLRSAIRNYRSRRAAFSVVRARSGRRELRESGRAKFHAVQTGDINTQTQNREKQT